MRCRSVLVGLLLVAAGCVSSTALPLGGERFPPRDPDHRVILFDTLEDVKRPYVKVARVLAEGSSEASWARVVAAMQAEARRVGADALVLGAPGRAVHGAGEDGIHFGKAVSALALRFVED